MEGSSRLPSIPEQGPQTVELAAQLEVIKEQVSSCMQLCRTGVTSLHCAFDELRVRTAFLESKTKLLCQQCVDKQIMDADQQAHLDILRRQKESPPEDPAEQAEAQATKGVDTRQRDMILQGASLSSLVQARHAALEADVDAIRTKLDRLVSVDFHAVAGNMLELQKQSSDMMDLVEEHRISLEKQIQRAEVMWKESFDELSHSVSAEVYAMIPKALNSILSSNPVSRLDTDEGLQECQQSKSVSPAGVDTNQSSSSDYSAVIQEGSSSASGACCVAEDVSGSSNLVEVFRDTLLTHFRGKFSVRSMVAVGSEPHPETSSEMHSNIPTIPVTPRTPRRLPSPSTPRSSPRASNSRSPPMIVEAKTSRTSTLSSSPRSEVAKQHPQPTLNTDLHGQSSHLENSTESARPCRPVAAA